MSSNCLNVNNHSLIIDITWSSFSKRKSWVIKRSAFNKTLIYHSNFTQIFIFAQKWSFIKLSFSYNVSMHEIAYQKVEELFFSLKIWWDIAHQIWWNTLIKFNEMSFIKFDEILFIRFDEIQFIRFDEMSSVKFDEKSSRSYQVWWVAFVKFDESLSSSLMNRLVKLLSSRKIELNLVRHFEKIRVEQSKHRR
jgi:hypothetical protein